MTNISDNTFMAVTEVVIKCVLSAMANFPVIQ